MSKKKYILVVDDEQDIREAISEELELEGYNTLEASNGNDAFEIVKTNSDIYCVITDMRMQNGDGLDLLSRIQKEFKGLPDVIIISGQTEISKEEIVNMGGIDLLEKPISIEKIIEAITKLPINNKDSLAS